MSVNYITSIIIFILTIKDINNNVIIINKDFTLTNI